MSGTDETYHLTKEDIRKPQSAASAAHGGNVPKDSEAAALQSIIDKAEQSKPDIIAERQANLPLPDAPPGASDFNSANARTVNVSSSDRVAGAIDTSDDPLRGPSAVDSSVRAADDRTNPTTSFTGVGRQGEENLGGLPNDAVARDSKDKAGLSDTTGADYGYPKKNDPTS